MKTLSPHPRPVASLRRLGARGAGALPANLPGLGLAVAVAAVATTAGSFLSLVGAPVIGMVLGVVLAAALKPGERLRPGIGMAARQVLQLSVVVLGSQLSLATVAEVGLQSLPVMLGTLAACLAAAYVVGRLLGIAGDLRALIGVGTGVCGASAIAAAAPVLGAASVDVAYAVSTIFLFNVSAVLLFPVLGHLVGMSQEAFGLFAGTAVNDMSSVVAAAASYGGVAANQAVVVKLVRTLMIIPICLGLAAAAARRPRTTTPGGKVERKVRVVRLVPWFLVAFLVVAGANSLALIPAAIHPALGALALFLITVALSAVGLSTDLPALRRAGAKPLLLGALLWAIVSLTSIGLQYAAGRI